MQHVATGMSCESPQTTAGRSSRVTMAALVLQQQLLVEADLLQPLAQFVQLAGQLLALQLLQHQVLPGQGEDGERTCVGCEPSGEGLAQALLKAEQLFSQVTADSGVLRAEQTVQRGQVNPRDVFQRAEDRHTFPASRH